MACAYGQVNREMINEVRSNVKEIKGGIKDLNNKVTELFNHQSNRLPLWATTLITILCSLLTGALTFSFIR